jgi:hypothetical protein
VKRQRRRDPRAPAKADGDPNRDARVKRLPALLLPLMQCMSGALSGQTFDLTSGRVPVASLDGLWRFHTGDNSAWADPNFDDSKWPLLRSDEGWNSQGYKDYSGLAWYRFQVSVPAGMDHVSLYLPQIRACYEVYADGKLIGIYGKMPPSASAYYSWLHYQLYSLPARKPGEEKIEVALRVWQWPGWVKYHEGGPQNGGGLVGDTQEIEHRNDLDRADMFEYVANSQILVLLETLAGFGTLALFVLRRKETEYLCFSLIMFFYAAFNWSLVFESTDVWRFSLGYFLRDLFANGAAFALHRLLSSRVATKSLVAPEVGNCRSCLAFINKHGSVFIGLRDGCMAQ